MFTEHQLALGDELEINDVVDHANRLIEECGQLRGAKKFSPRTVHYYVKEGLILRPNGRGRNTTYPPQTVNRLLFIRLMQKKGESLGDIEKMMRGPSHTDETANSTASWFSQIDDESITRVLLGKEPLDIRFPESISAEEIAQRKASGEQVLHVPAALYEDSVIQAGKFAKIVINRDLSQQEVDQLRLISQLVAKLLDDDGT